MSAEGDSSFIPFCAYQSDLAISDHPQSIQGISFPACSSFQQTILEGQQCYKLKLNRTSGQGKGNELLLILDYNQDRSIQPPPKKKKYKDTSATLHTFGRLQDISAKVQINTLSSYQGYGGGSYKMTAVKKMTTTSDFLKMSLKDRNCEVEEYEDCRTRNLLKECSIYVAENKQRSTFQDCLEKYASKTFNCSVSCKGIYADVEWNDEEVLKNEKKTGNGVELNREKLFKIMQEYQERKTKFVKNFVYKADKNYPFFGRFLLSYSITTYTNTFVQQMIFSLSVVNFSDAFLLRGGTC